MAPIIEVNQEDLERLNQLKIPYQLKEEISRVENSKDNFIYVPSVNLYVARERTHQRKNWHESHKSLAQENSRMPTIPEWIEFAKYVRENAPEVYEDVTAVKNPWRAEWSDAYFEQREDGLYILTGNKTKAEKLDEATLMEDRTPGISLDSWLENPTNHGLPRKNVKKGNLYYWHPRNGIVARFDADSDRTGLFCDRFPSDRVAYLGVRAVKNAESLAR